MILVVDDDISVTTSLSLLLKQAGYQTATAASPAEGPRMAEARRMRTGLAGHELLAPDQRRGGHGIVAGDQAAVG